MLEFHQNLGAHYVKSSSEALIKFLFFSKQVNVTVTILKYNLNVPCWNVLLINDKAVSFV